MKKLLFSTIAIMAGFMFTGDVSAAKFDQLKTDPNNIDVTGTAEDATLTLTGDAKQDIEVLAGQKFTIDLKNFTLEGFYKGSSVIAIEPGATVIIKGTGTIKCGSDKETNAATIDNKGTLTIQGGTIEASGPQFGAAVYNEANGNFTMTGGTIKTMANGVWGINNVGTAKITNGTFIQNYNFSVISNDKDMTITGGTFKAEGNEAHYSLLTTGATVKTSTLEITGGDFTSQQLFSGSTGGTVTIKGGIYSDPDAVKQYVAEGYVLSGNQVIDPNAKTDAPEAEDENALDNVPKTGSCLPIALIGLLGLATLAGAYSLKLAYARK